jgi:lipoate-protein ligase A
MLAKKAIGVSQALGRDVNREELEREIVKGFRDALGWELEPGELTEAESAEAMDLAEEKYGRDRWTMERGRLEGGIY